MHQFLPYIVAGLTAGSIYGLAGSGLVITYKTSGIFNFAHPALAAVGAYVFYFLNQDSEYFNFHLDWPLSAAIAILVAGPIMGYVMEIIVRGLASVTASLQVLATIGLSLGIIGSLGLLYQNNSALQINPFLPTSTFSLFGVYVGYDQLTLFLFGAVTVSSLFVFFRVTRLGTAMRAVVDNPDLMSLTGTSAVSVRRWAWLIGATFASASGVLLGPTIGSLSAYSFFLIVVSAFGAAAIGVFRSLPGTFGGGLLIGILGSLSTKYEGSISWLSGIDSALPFIVLFVVLIIVKPSKLADLRVLRPRPLPRSYSAPWRVRVVSGAVVVGLLALVPVILQRDIALWGSALIYTMLFLSLGLMVKESGQVSLCQTAFAAIGAVAFVHAVTQWGVPWFVALVFAAVVSGAVGLLVAIPAIRVSGVFLALATLGFGLALQNMVYPTSIMFTQSVSGLPNIPRPGFIQTNTEMYLMLLVCTVLVALLVAGVIKGRLGRLLRGLADSPRALSTMGASVNVSRAIVFFIAAAIAGLAGALYGMYYGAVGLETPLFQPILSLTLFAIVMLIAAGDPWYALLGGISIELIPGYLSEWFPSVNISSYTQWIFGLSAVLVALQADRRPMAPAWFQRLAEKWRPAPREEIAPVVAAGETPRVAAEQASGRDGLSVEGLTVRFGGAVAVDGLTIEAPLGRITGLIGPNGAGKTTTFNACSGLNHPSSGSIGFRGNDVSRYPPARRARLGIGRTFQTVDLWDSLTVQENVELGCEAALAGAGYLSQVAGGRRQHRRVKAAAAEAMRTAGISELAQRRTGRLSTPERRLVELARVLAGSFTIFLLDEPSSGLDREESERFGSLLQQIVRERGIGVLLVEHDMEVVMRFCDYIYVMDFGRKIFEGTPDEVRASDVVRSAYLGGARDEPLEQAIP